MSEDSIKLASEQSRRALSDLTNVSNKRGISSVLGHKSGDESDKTIPYEEDSGIKFSKRLCLVVDDLVKGNASPIDKNKGFSSDESGESLLEISSGGDGEASNQIYFEPGDRYGARELNAAANAIRTDAGEGLALSVLSSNSERQNSVVVREELPKCQNLQSFEMSRCSNVNKNEVVNQNMGDDDLLKTCSCSFCLKAAYIWSDLHYQDIKGRLFALKKSQKEASNLIQRNDKERPTDLHTSLMESDLMGQWRSLFLSMGDILAHESCQLQNSFLTMKELREDCKVDLERETKTPQHNNT